MYENVPLNIGIRSAYKYCRGLVGFIVLSTEGVFFFKSYFVARAQVVQDSKYFLGSSLLELFWEAKSVRGLKEHNHLMTIGN